MISHQSLSSEISPKIMPFCLFCFLLRKEAKTLPQVGFFGFKIFFFQTRFYKLFYEQNDFMIHLQFYFLEVYVVLQKEIKLDEQSLKKLE
jgi:hypothetical protein